MDTDRGDVENLEGVEGEETEVRWEAEGRRGVERGRLHGVINLLTNPGLGQDAVARDEMPGLLSTD